LDVLARQWVIAANFREPADYDIPEAPAFRAVRQADGTVALYSNDSGKLLMTAKSSMKVRR
jgi:hypothetical protein